MLAHGEDKMLQLTDWSFGQLCRLAGVAKDTVKDPLRTTPFSVSQSVAAIR